MWGGLCLPQFLTTHIWCMWVGNPLSSPDNHKLTGERPAFFFLTLHLVIFFSFGFHVNSISQNLTFGGPRYIFFIKGLQRKPPHHQTSLFSFPMLPFLFWLLPYLTSYTFGSSTYVPGVSSSALIASQLDGDGVSKFIKGGERRKGEGQDNVRNLSSECGICTQTPFSHSLYEQFPWLLCLRMPAFFTILIALKRRDCERLSLLPVEYRMFLCNWLLLWVYFPAS